MRDTLEWPAVFSQQLCQVFTEETPGGRVYLSWQSKLKHDSIREKYMQMFN